MSRLDAEGTACPGSQANTPKAVEAAGIWRENSHRLLSMCSLAAEAAGKEMGKDSLLLVVANNVVVHSSGDAFFDGRIMRSSNEHHRTHRIGFIDTVGIEGLPYRDRICHRSHGCGRR